jgi:type I site-specific restriction endonuclease
MPTPEELARENIDKQLEACGWIVQSRAEMEAGLVRTTRLMQAVSRSAFASRRKQC